MYEQLAQGRYVIVTQPGVEPATSRSLVQHSTITPPDHVSQGRYVIVTQPGVEPATSRSLVQHSTITPPDHATYAAR